MGWRMLLSVLIGLSLVLSTSGAKKFSFVDFFEGKWVVESRVLPTSDGQPATVTIGNYELNKVDDSLVGLYYENVTGSTEAFKNALRVRVQADTPETGSFQTFRAQTDIFTETLSAEPDLKFKTLFSFDFVEHRNGLRISTGEWEGKKKGTYQFTITSPTSFLLNVISAEDPSVIQTTTGTKDSKKSLFEQYGSTAVIFLVFGASKVLQSFSGSKARRAQRRQAQGSGAAGGAAAAVQAADAGSATDKKSD